MRRLVPAFFVLVAMVLFVIFLTRKTSASTEVVDSQGQISSNATQIEGFTNTENALGIEDSSIVSFMPLKSDETLLGSSGLDLNEDNYDDEILVVRKGSAPFLYLIVGLYNPNTSLYDRVSEIRTEITQLRSLSYDGIDVTGDHRIALVYQGFTDDGNAVLQMFFCRRSGLINIGSFKSDGTIFIQQYARSDTYELSQSSDRSFPVWTYASDTREGAGSLSQVQTEYEWNESVGHYVQHQQIFVTGKNIAAAELAKIQDGTVETFANYLNGLWYMTDSEDNKIRYIFFDYPAREVIFLVDDSQEVYNWQASNLYRNGIYLSTVNISIENLRRRFDIGLTGLNEMRVHVYDDVRMRIGTDALWNGQYKKMNMRKDFNETEEIPQALIDMRETFEHFEQWIAPDGAAIVFKNGAYTIGGDVESENGIYFVSMIGSNFVIQFNSRSDNRYFSDVYIVTSNTEKHTLILQPARIMANEVFEIPGRMITLSGQ